MKNKILQLIANIYLYIVYKIKYSKEHKGFYLKKRITTLVLFSFITIPYFMIFGIYEFYKWAIETKGKWFLYENIKLSKKQKQSVRRNLI